MRKSKPIQIMVQAAAERARGPVALDLSVRPDPIPTEALTRNVGGRTYKQFVGGIDGIDEFTGCFVGLEDAVGPSPIPAFPAGSSASIESPDGVVAGIANVRYTLQANAVTEWYGTFRVYLFVGGIVMGPQYLPFGEQYWGGKPQANGQFSFDTHAVPDGTYSVQVVATSVESPPVSTTATLTLTVNNED